MDIHSQVWCNTEEPPKMNFIQKSTIKIDNFQRHYRLTAFSYAVIKKYSEDETGYQAALLTYYGFLALFPLLLILTTVTSLVSGGDATFQRTVIDSTTNYFPVLGDQLSQHVYSLHKHGFALVIGILFMLYGTRGVADAFRHGAQLIWHGKKEKGSGFPTSLFRSIIVIIVGGGGFIMASILAGFTATAGHGLLFNLLSMVVNVFILYWLFIFLLSMSLQRNVPYKDMGVGAIAAAIGLVLLQAGGSYLLKHELHNLDALYSYFALPLGLLFWIYLQAQVIFYAIEIAAVSSQKKWPRSLSGHNLTPADKTA